MAAAGNVAITCLHVQSHLAAVLLISTPPTGCLLSCTVQLQALKIPLVAPSLGGVESLITRPATTTHVGMKQEERQVSYYSLLPFNLCTAAQQFSAD